MATRGACVLLLALLTLTSVQLPAESTTIDPSAATTEGETTTTPTTPSTEPTTPSTEPTTPSTEPTTPSTEPTTPSTEPTTPSTLPTTTTPPTTTPDPFPRSADLPNVTLLDEAVQQGHQVFMFRVTDDKGGFVIPRILNDTRFRILPVDGDPSLWRVMRTDNGTLERNDFELTIQLKDDDGFISNETLYIFVIGNDPPRFPTCPFGSRLGPNVPASTGMGATIDTMTAVDNDTVTYSMNCTPSAGPFVIDYATGRISTTRPLRTETVDSYSCGVTANDGKLTHNSSTCVLTIGIIGINKPPVFREKANSISVGEASAAPGSVQFAFSPSVLSDPNDPNLDNVTLACVFSPASADGILELDNTAKTIKLKAGQRFDFETETTYTVYCEAIDDGGLKDNYTLTINVMDGNDPPVFQTPPPEVILYEGMSAAGDTDLNPLVTDQDANDTRKFTLLTGSDADKFSMDPITGVLTHKGTLPSGSASATYTVTVKVTDKGFLSANTTMTVVVLDKNDNAPEFLTSTSSLSPVDLHLQLPFNTLMGSATATDKDAGTNAQISYMAGASSNCSGLSVKEDGKVEVVTSPLAMPYKSYCVMEINCTDKGNPPLACKNTYKLYFKWDEPPKIAESHYEGEISEDAVSGSCVPGITIDVTDTANDTIRCSKAASPAPQFVVKQTGAPPKVTVTVCFKGPPDLDRSTPVHNFNLVCSDSNPANSTATVTVRIKPNEPPKCPTDSALINAKTYSVDVAALKAYPVEAVDPEKDVLECPTTTWSPLTAPFTCNALTCICTATDEVKRTDLLEFTAAVTVRDKRNTVTCSIIFKITNPNKPPELDGYQREIPPVLEDSQDVAFTTRKLIDLTVTDTVVCDGLDCTTSVTPSHYSHLFDIQFNRVTKKITVNTATRLNKEEYEVGFGYRDSFDFTFQCSDGCKTMVPKVTTLKVNNVNEKPVFRGGDTYFATFKETETSKIVDLGCDMFDPDRDETHTLTIDPALDYIHLYDDPKTCSIRLFKEYDLDTGNLPTVKYYTITAKDKGGKTATATVRVNFELENDNYPQCKSQGYNKKVYYGTNPGAEILPRADVKVVPDSENPSATDKDKGIDGITTCRLKEATNGGGRYVDVHSDCQVVLTNSMDGKVESGDFFDFDIEICDSSPTSPKCGYCRLTVQYLATTPPPPVTQPPTLPTTRTAATPTTRASAVSTEAADSSSIWSNPGIIALIAALGLCGLGLLGLGGYLLYRACSSAPKPPTNLQGYQPASKPGQVTKVKEAPKKADKPKKEPKKPKEPKEPKKPKEKKPEKPKPSTPPNQVHPATPSSIQIEEPAPPAYHMFEFNKERFDDGDYIYSPMRDGMPDV